MLYEEVCYHTIHNTGHVNFIRQANHSVITNGDSSTTLCTYIGFHRCITITFSYKPSAYFHMTVITCFMKRCATTLFTTHVMWVTWCDSCIGHFLSHYRLQLTTNSDGYLVYTHAILDWCIKTRHSREEFAYFQYISFQLATWTQVDDITCSQTNHMTLF